MFPTPTSRGSTSCPCRLGRGVHQGALREPGPVQRGGVADGFRRGRAEGVRHLPADRQNADVHTDEGAVRHRPRVFEEELLGARADATRLRCRRVGDLVPAREKVEEILARGIRRGPRDRTLPAQPVLQERAEDPRHVPPTYLLSLVEAPRVVPDGDLMDAVPALEELGRDFHLDAEAVGFDVE